MAFNRMEGFSGSIPQGFIDNRMKICPLCGSAYPHWAIDLKMQFKIEGNLYLFRCEQCKGVLSSPVPDVTGFNNTALTTTGLLKRLSGRENGVIYLRIYDAGANVSLRNKVGTEYTLEELNQMALARCGANRNTSARPSGADELRKYKELLDAGIITQEEFEKKKKQILGF